MKRHRVIGGAQLARFNSEHQRDYVSALLKCRKKFGDTVYLARPGKVWLFFAPADVQEVLQKKNKFFVRDSDLKSPADQGVIYSEGVDWQQQRKGLSPIFRESILQNFVKSTWQDVSSGFDEWSVFANTARPFDAFHEINKLFLRLSCQALFGYDIRNDEEAYIRAFKTNSQRIVKRYTSSPYSIRHRLIAGLMPLAASEKTVLEIADRIIENDRGPGESDFSAISHLLDDSPGTQTKSRKLLQQEVTSLLNATFASTAVTFAWILYLIGNRPQVKEMLCQELSEFGEKPAETLEELSQLTFVDQVIKESMRLYPAIPVLKVRRAVADVTINGCPVRRGERVVVSPFVTHRDPEHWPDAEHFSPERFAPQQESTIQPFAFFPFGDGPRSCPGNHLANMNLKIFVAAFLHKFDFELDPTIAVCPRSDVICRPDPGVFITLGHSKVKRVSNQESSSEVSRRQAKPRARS